MKKVVILVIFLIVFSMLSSIGVIALDANIGTKTEECLGCIKEEGVSIPESESQFIIK